MCQIRSTLLLPVLALLLAACGSQVSIDDPTIPEPMIDKLPMKVAGRYPEAFDNYVHEEQVVGKEKWTIRLGASNKMLFTQLFGSMFTDYQVIDSKVDPQEIGIDALIEPSIDAFEFSVPNQSKTESFAVWIRYRIKVFDHLGAEVANWPVSAYGKSQTESISGTQALQRAAILAMRDAAALMIMKLDEATGISRIAAARASATTAVPQLVSDTAAAAADAATDAATDVDAADADATTEEPDSELE